MTLDKAIEILDDLKDSGIDAGHYDAEDAIQLGIEALKRLQFMRQNLVPFTQPPLPGEDSK
jgi:hypothetical protein